MTRATRRVSLIEQELLALPGFRLVSSIFSYISLWAPSGFFKLHWLVSQITSLSKTTNATNVTKLLPFQDICVHFWFLVWFEWSHPHVKCFVDHCFIFVSIAATIMPFYRWLLRITLVYIRYISTECTINTTYEYSRSYRDECNIGHEVHNENKQNKRHNTEWTQILVKKNRSCFSICLPK